jgi:hypothetical protein
MVPAPNQTQRFEKGAACQRELEQAEGIATAQWCAQ